MSFSNNYANNLSNQEIPPQQHQEIHEAAVGQNLGNQGWSNNLGNPTSLKSSLMDSNLQPSTTTTTTTMQDSGSQWGSSNLGSSNLGSSNLGTSNLSSSSFGASDLSTGPTSTLGGSSMSSSTLLQSTPVSSQPAVIQQPVPIPTHTVEHHHHHHEHRDHHRPHEHDRLSTTQAAPMMPQAQEPQHGIHTVPIRPFGVLHPAKLQPHELIPTGVPRTLVADNNNSITGTGYGAGTAGTGYGTGAGYGAGSTYGAGPATGLTNAPGSGILIDNRGKTDKHSKKDKHHHKKDKHDKDLDRHRGDRVTVGGSGMPVSVNTAGVVDSDRTSSSSGRHH